jgi:tctex1 domain-containing protein 2
MADRRFTIQTETRAMNTTKAGSNTVRDDIQAQLTGTNPSMAIAAAAAATAVPERRQSVFRRLSMSMGSRKSSMMPFSNQPRPNTYRMEPENDYRFRPYRIQPKVLEILVDQLKDKPYNPAISNDQVKEVSRSVLQLMKNFQMPRYKIIVQTVICQKLDQLIRIASRCLWDPKTDNMISVNYETQDMIAVVTVYGVYLD